MFIDKNSIEVNNISFGQYLVQADYGYNKLWASDSGRNLAGEQTGTLVGIFPKIEMQFRKLSQAELHTIAPILDSASQTVKYYDDTKGAYVTMSTYTGDWKVTNRGIGQNEGFTISFIARKRRE